MTPDFDEIIDRRGTHCDKWDEMERLYGVSPETGIPMWVADMDFRPPAAVQAALRGLVDHGIYGYFGDDRDYRAAIRWWMAERHGWAVADEAILTTHGLVNATGLCLEAFTRPGDAVVIFTPVYHAFARVIRAGDRVVTEIPMPVVEGRYVPDFDEAARRLTGREKVLILCSPHNPGGRVWTQDELRGYADFAKAHDLILISDEIHHDLVYPGARHHVLETACPDIADRLVTLTAATKTFNLAGIHTGNIIIHDPALRARVQAVLKAQGVSPNAFGPIAVTAAYSPAGAAWLDQLNAYLDGNRRIFDAGIAAIPGLCSMPLEATYLAWVDFAGTGMTPAEFGARVKGAGIAASSGFGAGDESFLRFNFATRRALVKEAVARLQKAFGDLQ